MTHTLNRKGLSEERPGEEIVVLCMVTQKEKELKREAMRQMVKTVMEYKPDNIIGAPLGLGEEAIIDLCAEAAVVTAVFSEKGDVISLVKDIKEQQLGISVVLSGLFGDVREVCEENNLKEHTYNISLGVFGKTERLPDEKTLEITTQCGHGLISANLVKHVLKKIKKGKMTSEEAAKFLIKPCVCGIGNPKRIANLLEQKIEQ